MNAYPETGTHGGRSGLPGPAPILFTGGRSVCRRGHRELYPDRGVMLNAPYTVIFGVIAIPVLRVSTTVAEFTGQGKTSWLSRLVQIPRSAVTDHTRNHHLLRFSSAQITLRGGVPGAIRTHGPQIRNLVLYPAELRGPTQAFIPSIERKRSPSCASSAHYAGGA